MVASRCERGIAWRVADRSYWETKMRADDEGIRALREVRHSISAEFGHDVTKLVTHYMLEQERYRERLLSSPAAKEGDAAADTSRRR
jgi:hypothetical protein